MRSHCLLIQTKDLSLEKIFVHLMCFHLVLTCLQRFFFLFVFYLNRFFAKMQLSHCLCCFLKILQYTWEKIIHNTCTLYFLVYEEITSTTWCTWSIGILKCGPCSLKLFWNGRWNIIDVPLNQKLKNEEIGKQCCMTSRSHGKKNYKMISKRK